MGRIINIAGKPLNCLKMPRVTSRGELSNRFVIPGYYWPDGNMPCMLTNGPRTLGLSTVRNIIIEAVGEYSHWSYLNFYEVFVREQARINFMWCGNGGHGDFWPYDGMNPTAGHTMYPSPYSELWGLPAWMSGDVHFNDAWTFTVSGAYTWGSIPMRWAALHEIGHALGLGHSEYDSAVMYGYAVTNPPIHLTYDDIRGIQAIYGTKVPI